MVQDKSSKVIGKINEIKTNIESFLSDVNVNDLKASFNQMVQDAQKDLNNLITRDLETVKKKLQKERTDIEKKAKKFLDQQKKELDLLQEKVEKLIKNNSQSKTMKTSAKKVTKKATTKKVSKKVSKVAKKVSKKV